MAWLGIRNAGGERSAAVREGPVLPCARRVRRFSTFAFGLAVREARERIMNAVLTEENRPACYYVRCW